MEQAPRLMIVLPSVLERRALRGVIEELDNVQIVAEAANGVEALSLAQDVKPHIVIIDNLLADITAVGLAHLMAAKLPSAQLLLYSDDNRRELIVNAVREGVRAFVLKSKVADHLPAAIEALVDRRPYWEGAVDDEILDELLQSGPRPAPAQLSTQEWQVLQMAAQGRSTRQIASHLGIGVDTAEKRRTDLRRKLGFRSFADLSRYAEEDRPESSQPPTSASKPQ